MSSEYLRHSPVSHEKGCTHYPPRGLASSSHTGGSVRGAPGRSTTPTHDNQRLLSSNIQCWVSGSRQDSSDSVGGQVLMFFVFNHMGASGRGHPTFFICLPALSCRLWWQQRGPEGVSSWRSPRCCLSERTPSACRCPSRMFLSSSGPSSPLPPVR